MFELSLRLLPNNPSALASLAMVYGLTGKLELAVDYLHRSVGVQPAGSNSTSSIVISSMLGLCIQLLVGKKSSKLNANLGKSMFFYLKNLLQFYVVIYKVTLNDSYLFKLK